MQSAITNPSRKQRVTREMPHRERSLFIDLWNTFWNPPDAICPKCGSRATEYYDPFFFALSRTLSGKRRVKCTECRFVWRSSRGSHSFWDRMRLSP